MEPGVRPSAGSTPLAPPPAGPGPGGRSAEGAAQQGAASNGGGAPPTTTTTTTVPGGAPPPATPLARDYADTLQVRAGPPRGPEPGRLGWNRGAPVLTPAGATPTRGDIPPQRELSALSETIDGGKEVVARVFDELKASMLSELDELKEQLVHAVGQATKELLQISTETIATNHQVETAMQLVGGLYSGATDMRIGA